MSHLDKIRNNIINKGNSYGSDMDMIDDKEIHETILHRGCTSRFREQELIESLSKCLGKRNIDYTILSDESCCGFMLFLLGDETSAKKVVDANVKKFNSHGVKRIITLCPGCYESFTQYYNHPDFDVEIIFAMDLFGDVKVDGTGYIIHDPCHGLDKAQQARTIINNVPDKRANSCCGFGAGIRSGSREVTRKMAEDTLSNEKVITYCPSCYHTLNRVNSDKTVDLFTLIEKELG